jgi:ABC-type transport system involved in multi-copper enzyme maturation permease subunit
VKAGELFASANRLQQQRVFKIVATCIVAVLAIAGIVAYAVAVNVPSASMIAPEAAATPATPEAGAPGAAGPTAADKTVAIINGILAAKQDATSVAIGIAIGAGLLIGVIWLGLGLTYMALGLAGALVVGLMRLPWLHISEHAAVLMIGIMALTAAFTALMRLVGLALSGALGATVFACLIWLLTEAALGRVAIDLFGRTSQVVGTIILVAAALVAGATSVGFIFWLIKCPRDRVAAIARNVLNEAVRMKISLVFIVMLIFWLAALPSWLKEGEPLRYHVQSFLQYGTGGAFWLIAVLVLTFSAASVTFEQRDKTIWQTMTKPVAAWEYVLGKWMGVTALCGVLLAVSASGVFLFTEYLRTQPAMGEREAYVTEDSGAGISEDRFVLETQVLTSRESRGADPYPLDEAQFRSNVEDKVQAELKQLRDSGERDDLVREQEQNIREKILTDLPKAVQMAYRSIEKGGAQIYVFSGLQAAREANRPILMRIKVNAGSNAPDALYRITIEVQNEPTYRIVECPLGQTISIRPPLLPDSIDANGVLAIKVHNADIERGTANNDTISFPPGGLELSYAVGSYRANFARVIGVLWVKLAFLAMLAIAASTFLSFPVACLVAFTTFLAAEGAGFILQSLESYQTETREGKTIIFNTIVDRVSWAVGHLFKIYSDLRPTGRLVDGLRLSWGDVSWGVAVLALCTGVLYLVGVVVFRRRELATYSGQ